MRPYRATIGKYQRRARTLVVRIDEAHCAGSPCEAAVMTARSDAPGAAFGLMLTPTLMMAVALGAKGPLLVGALTAQTLPPAVMV